MQKIVEKWSKYIQNTWSIWKSTKLYEYDQEQ